MRKDINREYTKEEQENNRKLLEHYNFMLGIAEAKANKRSKKIKRNKIPYAQTLAEQLNPKLKAFRERNGNINV